MIKTSTYSITTIRSVIAILSALMSIWLYNTQYALNADAITYIDAINSIILYGSSAIGHPVNWPFYTIINAWLSSNLNINPELMLKIFNSFMFVILTDALVLISGKLLENKEQIWVASILFLSFSTLNNYRDFIIRDIGYWAFSAYAIYFFIRLTEQPGYKNTALWLITIVTAFLFRIEAIIFAALIPFFLLFSKTIPLKKLSLLWLTLLIVIALPAAYITFQLEMASAFAKLSEIMGYTSSNSFFMTLKGGFDIIKQQVMNPAADHHASLVLVSGLIVMVIWETATATSLPYLILTSLSVYYFKTIKYNKYSNFLIYLFIINSCILILFALKNQLMTTRYCIFGALLLLLILLPNLTCYISHQLKKKKWLAIILIFILFLVNFLDSFITTEDKPHMVNVPIWAAKELPADSKVMTTDKQLHYYLNKYRNDKSATLQSTLSNLDKFDYFIVYVKKDDQALNEKLSSLPMTLIRREGNDNNEVRVYDIHIN